MDRKVWEKDIGPFLDHVLKGLCRGDEALFHYVIRWLAMTVLRPWQKLRQCVVLQAEEGTGKGTLVEIIKQCIGEQYITAPPTLEEALEGFNASYVDTCLLMFLDEAFFGGSKKINGGLKKLITEPYVASREKFRENRSVDNKFNIIMASNEEHVVQSHKNGRRHVVLECSNDMAGASSTPEQISYFGKLRATDSQTLVNYFNSLDMEG
jgi:phage/plasmid-associated DNA primase